MWCVVQTAAWIANGCRAMRKSPHCLFGAQCSRPYSQNKGLQHHTDVHCPSPAHSAPRTAPPLRIVTCLVPAQPALAAGAALHPPRSLHSLITCLPALATPHSSPSTPSTVHVSDNGLMPRTASGPVVNYDDPDAYWDALEGGRTPPAPATEYVRVKYVEAAQPTPVLGELADLNGDVRGLANTYRDPLIAGPQDKTTGGPAEGRGCRQMLCLGGCSCCPGPAPCALWRLKARAERPGVPTTGSSVA